MKRGALTTLVQSEDQSIQHRGEGHPIGRVLVFGWRPTGHWQCGPVRIITSTDGFGGLDVFVVGAWFDNHDTLPKNNFC